ncbi:glycine cleavage system aminomethyltransferase GcvT [Prochlorothrix hollandica]|uniref:glycine cleavage system aminomethyltransferase GcvT n=1 Tax=Prochlorothrix hollandica TaxID=1223 RepID=UPI00333F52C3
MTEAPPSLLRTPLHDQILSLGAKMTEFGGWDMPVHFSSLLQEHQQVRTAQGIFDISHMGKFVLRGQDVLAQLDRLVPSALQTLPPGAAQYTVLLNDQGGIVDDLIVYAQDITPGQEVITLIVNAATCHKDKQWLLQHLDSDRLELEDLSQSHTLLAIQGPQAVATLQALVPLDLAQVSRFGHVTTTLQGQPAFLARTGYTGEDGFEVMQPAAAGQQLWDTWIQHGVTPCGLGARDTLRLEAAMGLYGQDMDDSTTPLEAGLGWLVHLDRKGDFIGRSPLEQQKAQGLSRRLVGLVMEGRNIARHDYPVTHGGEIVGTITSGTWSPTLAQAIALAYVPPHLASLGQSLSVTIRGKNCPGAVVKRPFYKR